MNNHKFTVLIISNQANELTYLTDLLVKEEYSVETFTSIELAREAVDNIQIDLILIDLEPPKIKANEVSKIFRNKANTRDIPIIFSVKLENDFDREEIFAIDNCDYLIKPWHQGEIIARLANQLQRKSSENWQIIRQLFDCSQQFVFVLTVAGNIIEVNQTALNFAGINPEDVINLPLWETSWWATSAANQEQLREAIATAARGELVRYDTEIQGQDTTANIDFTVQLLSHEGGESQILICEGWEITSRKLAIELENQGKSHFLVNMNHELRTPLNAIIGFSQLLLGESLTSQQQEYVAIIDRNGEYLLSLVNDILEISAIEGGKVTLHKTSFDFYEFLDALEEIPQIKAVSKGLELNFELAANLPQQIYTDKAKLRQVLTSLLDYAIRYTQEGQIYLNVSSRANNEQQLIRFEISSTSSVINPEEVERQPFEGESEAQTNLALLITQKIAHLLEAQISINREIAQGNIFSLEISVQEMPTVTATPTATPLPNSLRVEDLSVMSREWIEELYQAALAVDDRQILLLVEQIPETEANLAELITNAVNSFRLDILVEVIEDYRK